MRRHAWRRGYPEEIEVWPENKEAVTLFLDCVTQWRACPMSGSLLGLRYTDLHAAAEWSHLTPSPDLFRRLRVLEDEVLRLSRES